MYSTLGTQDPELSSGSEDESQLSDGEPGPAIDTDYAGSTFTTTEVDYFRTLPESVLAGMYPCGIYPPVDLGPATPYDRYDQFHQALLYVAAGIPLSEVIHSGDFKISDKVFVKHMADFCAKTLDYDERDISLIREEILAATCTHTPEGKYCMKCSRKAILSIHPASIEDHKANRSTRKAAHRNNRGSSTSTSTSTSSTSSTNATNEGTPKLKLGGRLQMPFLRYILLLVVMGFLYEMHLRPLLTSLLIRKESVQTTKMQA